MKIFKRCLWVDSQINKNFFEKKRKEKKENQSFPKIPRAKKEVYNTLMTKTFNNNKLPFV